MEAATYLGCLVLGANAGDLEAGEAEDLARLLATLRVRRHPPRALRHRIQNDRHGLDMSLHRLLATEDGWRLDLDVHGPPVPQVVGALVALDRLEPNRRGPALEAAAEVCELASTGQFAGAATLHEAVAATLFDGAAVVVTDSRLVWALETLELPPDSDGLGADTVQRAYRRGVRAAHPDHGADDHGAADRLMALRRARDLLLGV